MKKRGFFVIAALFLFVTLFPLGAYAADVYAILYEDGEMVFQYGDATEPNRAVKATYEVNLTAVYNSESPAPWYNERKSIRVVNFADKISPGATAYWFYQCYYIERVDNVQNLDTSNITNMESMFAYCYHNLTALDLSSWDTANVTNMRQIFSGCSGLTALDLSSWDTANVTDMREMFRGCSGLTMLDLSSFNTAHVVSMGGMFAGCSELATLDLSSFSTTRVNGMAGMFNGCKKLTELDLSSFNVWVNDGGSMFMDCISLKTIYTSDRLHFNQPFVEIFQNCIFLVGGNGTKYDKSHINRDYAEIDRVSTPGYFTYKAAPVAYAITAAAPENGKLSVTLTNPGAATLAVSYFADNGKFVSAILQSVDANAGTVTLELAAGAKTARVMLLDSDFRPLCAAYSVGL